MGKIVLGLSFLGAFLALFRPWIGVVDGYLSILLGPQVLWWWAFEGKRHFLIISVCTIIGFLFLLAKNEINFNLIKNKQNLYLFLWLIFFIISFLFGPYVGGGPGERYFQPDYVFSIFIKAFIFYFISILCIDDDRKFKYLCMVIVFVGTYYIYWINNRYLSGYYGRLGGPVGLNIRQYGDQNNFAMFFVISLPFIYYYGYTLKNVFFRYALWLIIPFGWHAIFLTGSRGGLLGLGVSLIPMILRSPKKIYGLLLLPAILIAFLWQGGPVMQERSATIFSEASEVDSSVQGRLDSWLAAAKMMSAHPITGVGVASFGMAYPDFSYADPKEAHNTYFQIGAESGVVAALGYILFLLSTLKALWKNMAIDGQMLIKRSDEDNFCHYMNDAVLSAWLGFGVCAMFLSLQLFEQFFYLAVLSNYIIQRKFKNYA